LNPFQYIASINNTKKDLMIGEDEEKAYSPFIVNRGLSYFQDTVLFANEMNMASHLDHRLQYDFLRGAIRPRKRFSKWMKKQVPAKIDVIKEYYGYSNAKAESVADLISDDDIKEMKAYLSQGGKKR
jgi:hypothetical protein